MGQRWTLEEDNMLLDAAQKLDKLADVFEFISLETGRPRASVVNRWYHMREKQKKEQEANKREMVAEILAPLPPLTLDDAMRPLMQFMDSQTERIKILESEIEKQNKLIAELQQENDTFAAAFSLARKAMVNTPDTHKYIVDSHGFISATREPGDTN